MHDEDERKPPRSGVRTRAPVRVMLVRVAPDCEPPELVQLAIEVLRVRHPIPACERMRVTRPELVLVGEPVRDEDYVRMEDVATEIGAELFPLQGYRSINFSGWFRGALRRALERRAG